MVITEMRDVEALLIGGIHDGAAFGNLQRLGRIRAGEGAGRGERGGRRARGGAVQQEPTTRMSAPIAGIVPRPVTA